jgi:hypothetical protein
VTRVIAAALNGFAVLLELAVEVVPRLYGRQPHSPWQTRVWAIAPLLTLLVMWAGPIPAASRLVISSTTVRMGHQSIVLRLNVFIAIIQLSIALVSLLNHEDTSWALRAWQCAPVFGVAALVWRPRQRHLWQSTMHRLPSWWRYASAQGRAMTDLPEMTTKRLLLRQWKPEDREPFAALNADPEVRRCFPML